MLSCHCRFLWISQFAELGRTIDQLTDDNQELKQDTTHNNELEKLKLMHQAEKEKGLKTDSLLKLK